MGHNDDQVYSNNAESCNIQLKNVREQLAEANDQIAELTMQLAWLERSYE